MIEIKPNVSLPANLSIRFSERWVVEDLLFMGMHVLVRILIPNANARYYHTLPTGHTCQFPVTFSLDGQEHYFSEAAEVWLARPLIRSMLQPRTVEASLQKKVYAHHTNVILLNCLDDCYGHMLYKLFNAQRHLEQDTDCGLIVLVPTSLVWMVPEGVAEIWHLDLPPAKLNAWITSLDGFVKKELSRFKEVYLSPADMQLDLSQIMIERFTREPPFSLAQSRTAPWQITFICREDRFWLTNRWDQLLYLASRKFRFTKYLKRYFIYKQNQKIRRTARLIGHQPGTVAFSAVGIGKTGSLGKQIHDQRVTGSVSEAMEHRWCRLYARSQIVIGVHGSSMLLPTALATGFINLLPDYKIPFLGGDTFLRYSRPYTPILAKFLPLESSPRLVARHAVHTLLALRQLSD